MNKNFLFTVVSVFVLLGMLAGCAKLVPTTAPTKVPMATEAPTAEPTAVPTPTPVVITDALGRTIEFATLPQRVVIAGKAGSLLADAVFMFPEAMERVVGFVKGTQTAHDFLTEVFPIKPDITFLESSASAEQIAPLKPDVVLMKSYLQKSLGDPIEQLGIKVVYLDLETSEAIDKDIRNLGLLFGNSTKAEEIVTLIDASVKKITDVTSTLTDDKKPSVLMLQYSDKGGEISFKVPPLDWLQTSLVTLAGGTPVWKDVPTDGWTIITLEQVAAWNPQVIFLIDYKGNAVDIVKSLKTDAKWSLLDAVKNDKLFAFPLDFQSWDQPDTRWPLALTWMAMKLHPDLFTSVDFNQEIVSFYKYFYSLDDSVINGKILPLVKGDL
jgi:iron complex transport system substrate-binding protein